MGSRWIYLILLFWSWTANAQDAEIRIGIVFPSESAANLNLNQIRDGAAKAAEEQGIQLIAQTSGKTIGDKVDTLLKSTADRPLDGVIIAAATPDGLVSGIENAVKSNIPAITVGSGAEIAVPAGALMHIGQDDFAAGRETADRLRDLGADRAICVRPQKSGIREELRCMGLSEGMDQDIEIQTLPDGNGNNAKTVERLMDRVGEGYAVVFVAANPLSSDIARAMDWDPNRIAPVVAFDPDPSFISHLAKGQAAFAVDAQPYLQGYLSVVILANAARTGQAPASGIETGPRFITVQHARAQLPRLPRDKPTGAGGGTSDMKEEPNGTGAEAAPIEPEQVMESTKGDALTTAPDGAAGSQAADSEPEPEISSAGDPASGANETAETADPEAGTAPEGN